MNSYESDAEIIRQWSSLWHPPIWAGMHLPAWVRLLWDNRFAVAPKRLPAAAQVTALATINTALWAIQELLFARKLNATLIDQHPVFILGHWRSGTTLLHELLDRDPALAAPNSYQCLSPHHFLFTERTIGKLVSWSLPEMRITGDMPLGGDTPQEEEFAICNMGLESPMSRAAFPANGGIDRGSLSFDQWSESRRQSWNRGFTKFVRQLTLRHHKRLVLKSPANSCRIGQLIRLFPDARFAYIVRNPCQVIPSTIRLWKLIFASQGLQDADFDRLEDNVLEVFPLVHDCVQRDREMIPENRFCEVRYEDLIANPLARLETIYQSIGLPGWPAARPAMADYLRSVAKHESYPHRVSAQLHEKIIAGCGDFMTTYGYSR